jgi:cation diffusion facilitator CzcD-associated flavoprotein CzcO
MGRVPAIRVVAFTGMVVPGYTTITPARRAAAECAAELRTYVDLPCVWVVDQAGASAAAAVLDCLAASRSPCIPYAVFVTGGNGGFPARAGIDVVPVATPTPAALAAAVGDWARARLSFGAARLCRPNRAALPSRVDVLVVGAGITGLYAAAQAKARGLSVCVVEKDATVGGIWTQYANATSQVNTSEPAYRLFAPPVRAHRDHSRTAEVLEDMCVLADGLGAELFTGTRVERIGKDGEFYAAAVVRDGVAGRISSRGVILAVNDRVGPPRIPAWEGSARFKGAIVNGFGDGTADVQWRDKRVVVAGMGAFAIENARTALEAGARNVTVVCRRHGTVCPKIVDYLNFALPYDARFQHERKASARTMSLWKALYDQSGATQPECWPLKMKHDGHTISVSDLWFIGHWLKKLTTVTGGIDAIDETSVRVGDRRIEADVIVACVGFHRNASTAAALCGKTETLSTNYVDRDFMYLADAHIDDNAHNSFFGSSVLEMVKFYVNAYLELFGALSFEQARAVPGVTVVPIINRKWNDYIGGAQALMQAFPRLRELARAQVDARSADFAQAHDLQSYLAANRREWFALHEQLAGRPMAERECLPFVFDKLIEKKQG